MEAESEKLVAITNLMNISLGYFEIEKYKITKYKMYCDYLKTFCRAKAPTIKKAFCLL